MSFPLIKKKLQDSCYEAVVEMIKKGIRHVVVEDEGKILGIVELTDLMEDEAVAYLGTLRILRGRKA